MCYAFRILSHIALVGGVLVTLAATAHATLNSAHTSTIETVRIEPQKVQEPPVAAEECYPNAIGAAVGADAQKMMAEKIGEKAPTKGERRSAASLTDAEREYWSTLELIEK